MIMKPLMASPCKDCPNRKPPTKTYNGCRTECFDWAEYSKQHDKLLAQKTHDYVIRDQIMGYDYDKATETYKKLSKDKRRKGPK